MANCCYGMLHCLCSGLVELIVNVQAQHINNRKYSNSYTINDECIQTIGGRTTVAQWLRCCAPNQKVTGSIPAGVTGIFH